MFICLLYFLCVGRIIPLALLVAYSFECYPFAFRTMRANSFALRCDFVAHPLARLIESILSRTVGFLEAAFNAVPSGLGGVLGAG